MPVMFIFEADESDCDIYHIPDVVPFILLHAYMRYARISRRVEFCGSYSNGHEVVMIVVGCAYWAYGVQS